MSFSEFEEDKLISIVAQYPVIYDVTHQQYRDIPFKDNVWVNIGNELQKNSEDCKKKWKFIRDSYQRFMKRNKDKIAAGSAAPRNSKDKRHQQLLFLEATSRRRRRHSFTPASPNDSKDVDHNQENEDDNATSHSSDLEDHYNNKTELNDEEITDNDCAALAKDIKRRRDSWDDENEKKRFKQTETSEDDVDLFCRHLSVVLRSLPPVYKAELKQHISVITSNYEVIAARDSFDLNDDPLNS